MTRVCRVDLSFIQRKRVSSAKSSFAIKSHRQQHDPSARTVTSIVSQPRVHRGNAGPAHAYRRMILQLCTCRRCRANRMAHRVNRRCFHPAWPRRHTDKRSTRCVFSATRRVIYDFRVFLSLQQPPGRPNVRRLSA